MNARLSFGEYLRRLRRGKKWNLHSLAEQTGLSYTHLSRMENESTLPRAGTVARLAEVLDGDLKIMLELADCLPRTILDRIQDSQERSGAAPLGRTAGPQPEGQENRSLVQGLASNLAQFYGISGDGAAVIGKIVDELVKLEDSERAAILTLVSSLSADGEDDEIR